ncbi:MAG: hypothetical protein JJE25_04460 [Bacteroidia bacterium]|nr:hypothetical protein [Bacteroidia bacterium]
MRKLFTLIFLLSAACESYSQFDSRLSGFPDFSPHEFYPGKRNVCLSSEYYFGSNGITNEFFNSYFLNRYINDELKNKVINRLGNSNNRLGAGFNTSLYFTYKTKQLNNVNKLFFAGISNRNFAEWLFSRDLFTLLFKGNKSYAGKTADFDATHFRLYQYQKMTWGTMNVTDDVSKVSYGFSGSLLIGQQLQDINVSGNLFTSDNGEFLDLRANGNLHASDSAHSSLASVNGLGVSGDLFFHYNVSELFKISFSVNDFGLMKWNDKTSLVSVDTNFHFEGVNVNDLFDFSDSVFTNSSLSDSAQAEQFLTHRKTQSYSVVLPARAALELTYLLNDSTVSLTLRDEVMSGDAYRNLATLRLGWKATGKIILSFEASYGGYGNLNAGIIASFLVKKNYSLTIGSHAVNGFIAPAFSTSQGAFVSLKKYL